MRYIRCAMTRITVLVGIANALLVGCDKAPTAELRYIDAITYDDLEGVDVSTDSASGTTNSQGKVDLEVPAAGAFVIDAVDPSGDRYPHRVYHNGFDGTWTMGQALVTRIDAEDIGAGLGVSLDNSLAIVEVSANWEEDNGDITEMLGATIDLESTYEIAVVEDFDAGSGWIAGNTIPTNVDFATVVFGNVAPGDVVVALTPPEAVGSCGAWPSANEDDTDSTVPAVAGEVTVYTFLCTRAGSGRLRGEGGISGVLAGQGIGLDVSALSTSDEALVLEGRVDQPMARQAGFLVVATPATAPRYLQIQLSDASAALNVVADRELGRLSFGAGQQRLEVSVNPDQSISFGGAVYQTFGRVIHAMAHDPRLFALTEANLIAWMVAAALVDEHAPTRGVSNNEIPTSVFAGPTLPGRLGCARYGVGSSVCRLHGLLAGI